MTVIYYWCPFSLLIILIGKTAINAYREGNKGQLLGVKASERLEPCAGKLACTVLRRASDSNVAGLSDKYRVLKSGSELI